MPVILVVTQRGEKPSWGGWFFWPFLSPSCWTYPQVQAGGECDPCEKKGRGTLQGINISHLGKRKIMFKSEFWWDMLGIWRVYTPPKKNERLEISTKMEVLVLLDEFSDVKAGWCSGFQWLVCGGVTFFGIQFIVSMCEIFRAEMILYVNGTKIFYIET